MLVYVPRAQCVNARMRVMCSLCFVQYNTECVPQHSLGISLSPHILKRRREVAKSVEAASTHIKHDSKAHTTQMLSGRKVTHNTARSSAKRTQSPSSTYPKNPILEAHLKNEEHGDVPYFSVPVRRRHSHERTHSPAQRDECEEVEGLKPYSNNIATPACKRAVPA